MFNMLCINVLFLVSDNGILQIFSIFSLHSSAKPDVYTSWCHVFNILRINVLFLVSNNSILQIFLNFSTKGKVSSFQQTKNCPENLLSDVRSYTLVSSLRSCYTNCNVACSVTFVILQTKRYGSEMSLGPD